jgi:hypothetical protein
VNATRKCRHHRCLHIVSRARINNSHINSDGFRVSSSSSSSGRSDSHTRAAPECDGFDDFQRTSAKRSCRRVNAIPSPSTTISSDSADDLQVNDSQRNSISISSNTNIDNNNAGSPTFTHDNSVNI